MSTPVRGRRGGRPTKFTPALQEDLLKALRAFNNLDTAARLVGVHPSTVRRWLAEGEPDDAPRAKREFYDAVTRARATAEVRIVAGVAKAAIGGTLVRRVTRTLRDGTKEVEEQFAPPDGRVGLEFLSRSNPELWARRSALEVTGRDGGPIQVRQQTAIVDLTARLQTMFRRDDDDELGDDADDPMLLAGEVIEDE